MPPKKNAGRKNQGKAEKDSGESRSLKSTGAIADLPVLQYVTGKATNNYHDFKEKVQVYVTREYKELGKIFDDDEYWEPPEVEIPAVAWNNVNDPMRMHREELKVQVQQRTNKIEKLKDNRSSVYAVIWGNMSKESQDKVKEYADFDETSLDPLALWTIITTSHLHSGTGHEEKDRQSASEVYTGLRQLKNESLASFKQRTDNALSGMESIGEPLPNVLRQGLDFIKRLDNSRFKDLKLTIDNNITMGVSEPPENLTAAYMIAKRFKVAKPDSNVIANASNVAFTAQKQNAKKPGKEKGKDQEQDNGGGKGPADKGKGGGKSGKKKDDKGTMICTLCGQKGHWCSKCPMLAQAREFLGARVQHTTGDEDDEADEDGVILCITADILTGSAESSNLNPWEILLDNQATVSVFHNKRLLQNIRRASTPITIKGIGGSLKVDLVGDAGCFGEVYFCPQATANLLCFYDVDQKHHVSYDRDAKTFEVNISENKTYKFVARGKLHVCDINAGRNVVLTNTVEENEGLYTKRELAAARQAKDLSKRLGYPSMQDLKQMLSTGSLVNCPITHHDIDRAIHIYGPDIAAVKGKTKSTKPNTAPVVHTPRPVLSEQTLHVDIMFIDGEPYMISVSTPMGMTMVSKMDTGKRDQAQVRKCLTDHISQYTARQYQIKVILTDGEGAVVTLTSELNAQGITVNPSGAGQHVPVVENKIRQVKERVRGILNTLPFTLPASLMWWLVKFCVSRLNMVPRNTKVDCTSPRETLLGRKLDFRRDLRIGFGEYVQAHAPASATSNSMAPRTDGAIALFPTGNLQGSVTFLNLTSMKTFTRDHWTALPMPTSVIAHLNTSAAQQKRQLSKDPIFRLGQSDIGEPTDSDDLVPADSLFTPPAVHIPTDLGDDPVEVEPEDYLPEQVVNPSVDPIDQPSDSRGGSDSSDMGVPFEDNQVDTTETAVPFEEVEDPIVTDEAIQAAPTPEVTESPPPPAPDPPDPPDPPRYNLRSNRSQGWVHGRWETRKYGLHITVSKALNLFGQKAVDTMASEISQIDDKKSWTPVKFEDLSHADRKKIIPSSMFLKEKYLSTGEFDKLKARLVAGGHRQDRALYESYDVSSPTPALKSVFLIGALAAWEGRYVVTVDFPGAFLNARMGSKVVYIVLNSTLAGILVAKRPSYEKYLRPDRTLVVKLLRALYGCVESAKLWFDLIKSQLECFGYTHNPVDICVFNKTESGVQCTVVVYVDDLMITCKSEGMIKDLIKFFENTFDKITVHEGLVHSYLGMTWDFSKPGKAAVSMEGYVQDVLKLYQVTGKAASPATEKLFEVNPSSPPLSVKQREELHSRVAKLLYLAKRTAPELLPAISFLSSRVHSPTDEDWAKLERVLKYLNANPKCQIVLSIGDDNTLLVVIYADASYGVHLDGKSHTGIVIFVGGALVFVSSSKQKLVTKSSSEAELVAASDATPEGIHTRELLLGQGYQVGPSTLYQDNKSTIALIEKGRSTSARTRHINIRYFFIKDRVASGEMVVQYKPTLEMVADVLTKPLQGELFRKLRAQLHNSDE